MYYYKTKLRLNGNTMHEVEKIASAPEFLILQVIHGSDALTNVTEIRNEKVNNADERERLRLTYWPALKRQGQTVDGMFGALSQLPERLPESLIEQFGIDEEGLALSEVRENIDQKEVLAIAKKTSKKVSAKEIAGLEREKVIVPASEVNIGDLMG